MADDRASRAVDNEREEIEQYMAVHGLESHLNAAVNEVVKERPEDPFEAMSAALLVKSERSEVVLGVSAREVISAAAFPALEVTVRTVRGSYSATTAVGPFDGDGRYDGRGVKKSVDSVTHLIQDKLVGQELNQGAIDAFLLAEPNLPENAILAVSMACCRAGAAHKEQALHEFLATLANVSDPCVPSPHFDLINGGDLGDGSPLPVQALTVTMADATSFEDALEQAARLHRHFKLALGQQGQAANSGATGGLVPTHLSSVLDLMAAVMASAKEVSLSDTVRFGLDLSARRLVATPLSSGDGDDQEDDDGGAVSYDIAKYSAANRLKAAGGSADGAVAAASGDGDGDGGEGGDGAIVDAAAAAAEGGGYGGSAVVAAAPAAPKAATSELKSGDELAELYFEWMFQHRITTLVDLLHSSDGDSLARFKERLDTEVVRTKERLAEANKKNSKGKKGGGGGSSGTLSGDALKTALKGEEGDEPVLIIEPLGNDPACYVQVTGHELCKSAEEMDRYHEEQTVNTMVVTLHKGKTVTGCIELVAKAQQLGWGVMVATETFTESGGETSDDFVAHLAVGTKAGQFRGGGLVHSEHTAKYNALLAMASGEGGASPVPFAGSKFRNFSA